MIQLPQLHESLLIANERLVDRARRRARLFRTGLISSAAVLSIGGAATAGLALWNPILGHEDGNRPSVSATPVPTAQSTLLGVLRRPQSAADRGVVAQEALAAASRRYVGVRLAAVRVLQGTGTGTGAGLALVPVAELRPRPVAGPAVGDDALCVFARTSATDSAVGCFGDGDVSRGAATGVLGSFAWGLVPDGVTAVEVPSAGGDPTVVRTRDNAFSVAADVVDRSDPRVRWLDAAGRTVEPAGDAAMTLPIDVSQPGAVPEGFHDCGPDQGDVVPDDVACGAEARRYPRTGTGVPDTTRP